MTYRQPDLDDSLFSPFDLELAEFWQGVEGEAEVNSSEADFMTWLGEAAISETETAAALSPWDWPGETEEDINELSSQLFGEGKATAPANEEFWADLSGVPPRKSEPKPPLAVPLPIPLAFYPKFEALEATIDCPAVSPTPTTAIAFEPLESLIATPSQLPLPSRDSQPSTTNYDVAASSPQSSSFSSLSSPQIPKPKLFDQTMRVPIRELDNLGNLIGELIIQRNQIEQQQGRLRRLLDKMLSQVQKLSEVGVKTQELYERSLLEGSLMNSRQSNVPNFLAPLLPATRNSSSVAEQLNALELDRFTGFHELSQEAIELVVRVRESAADIEYVIGDTEEVGRHLRQVTSQLQEGMTKSRMVPFSQSADRLPRAVREISLRLNKQVELEVEGREILIDKMLLEHLSSPITHLINNAITHGIEAPELRTNRGKPAAGKITIRACIQGNQTVISVSDDGDGIDVEQVRAKAIAQGIIPAEQAKNLSYQDLHKLLFYPGFTTKDRADDFSGRGVGLDVVQTSLQEVRGTVSLESLPGRGTTFTIRLPLVLNICKVLCCWSGQSQIAFPLEIVEDTREVTPGLLAPNEQGIPSLRWRKRLLPCYSLSQLLSYNYPLRRREIYASRQEGETASIVILRSGSEFLAVQVERLLNEKEQEIVIKPIEGPVLKPSGIAGAAVLADGSIMLIGDAVELREIAEGQLRTDGNLPAWELTAIPVGDRLGDTTPTEGTVLQKPEQLEPLVLIVDDSITVRELLSLSFSKNGYRVEQARDGQEAWEKLSAGLSCDLIFCDVEMPRLSGLELLSQLKNDEELAGIPFALLTSRGADRHRQIAAELGASGYLTKPYTDKELLDAAARMLRGEVLLSGGWRTTLSGLGGR